jgi:hypothetical protein
MANVMTGNYEGTRAGMFFPASSEIRQVEIPKMSLEFQNRKLHAQYGFGRNCLQRGQPSVHPSERNSDRIVSAVSHTTEMAAHLDYVPR